MISSALEQLLARYSQNLYFDMRILELRKNKYFLLLFGNLDELGSIGTKEQLQLM